jgi:4-hydroxy-tetrahydrodipicolinate synthase
MKSRKFNGAVVPIVTPVTADGRLDEPSLVRSLDHLLAGGVDGIFVMGTTGEGAFIPGAWRRRIVEQTVAHVRGAARVFAGLADEQPADITEANDYLSAGADAVVARPPVGMPEAEMLPWFRALLDGINGPLLLYNIPMTTKHSIPLDTVEELSGHPRLAGLKDSENNPARLAEVMRRFGNRRDFSIFIGVGALMQTGLRLGADGIVPSVGNLIPEVCRQLCEATLKADWPATEMLAARMNSVASLYQKGRNLNESLAALKAAMHCHGFCGVDMLPPLHKVSPDELEQIRVGLSELNLCPSS